MSATDLYSKDEYCLANDKLDRGKQVDLLVKYIENIDTNFVMNINSPFGTGKSFFLGILEEKLEKNDGYKVISINAWENDDQNPAMMFLAEIYNILKKEKAENELEIIEKAMSFGSGIIKNGSKLGLSLVLEKYFSQEIAKKMRETLDLDNLTFKQFFKVFEDSLKEKKDPFKAEIEAYIKKKKSRQEFKVQLEKLTQTKKIIIIIDDLDRCKPTFALELLETIKHVFDISGIIFVLATDFEQLKHTVSRVYGEIENEGYLKRFIDREFILPLETGWSFITTLLKKYEIRTGNREYDFMLVCLSDKTLSLRAKEKMALVFSEYISIGYSDNIILGLYLIYLKEGYPKFYNEIVSGKRKHWDIFLGEINPPGEYQEFYDKFLSRKVEVVDRAYSTEKINESREELLKLNLSPRKDLEFTRLINEIEFLM